MAELKVMVILKTDTKDSVFLSTWNGYMLNKILLLLMLYFCYCEALRAYSPLLLTSDIAQQHSRSLETNTAYIYDHEGLLTIDDIRLETTKWRSLHEIKDGYFGIGHGAVWLAMEINSTLTTAHTSILNLQYSYLDYVYFYLQHNDGEKVEFKSGRKVAVDQWPILSRKIAIPIDFYPNDRVKIFIRIASESPLIASPQLMSRNAFSSSDRQGIVILSMYMGMVLALAIYNLLLAIVIRRTQFLLYSAYIVSFGMAVSIMTGLAPLLLPGLIQVPSWFVPFMFCVSISTSLFFAREFLSMNRYSNALNSLLKILGSIGFFIAIMVVFIDIQKTIIIVSVQALIVTTVLIAVSAYAIYRGIFAARIFFSAWICMFFAIVILTLRNYGLFPSNFLGVYSVQIGSSLEMMILAFALAARFNEMRRTKDIAQKSLVKALKEQESILESRVKTRTSELQMAKTALERLATEDSLTGLLNRRGLEIRYQHLEKMANRLSLPIAVALIDLDDFKPVNDNYGHEAGDELLCVISQRLINTLRDTDAVGRLGGDEFVYLSVGRYSEEELMLIIERIRKEISVPVEVQTFVEVKVGASVGVCYSRLQSESFQSLLRCADEAMYQVKHNGKQGIHIVNKT